MLEIVSLLSAACSHPTNCHPSCPFIPALLGHRCPRTDIHIRPDPQGTDPMCREHQALWGFAGRTGGSDTH
ncbi:hypothetical protein XENTR_v10003203 [Xenopus tropicalis]|nr:hypothetical protein XENTR_v10003203 [Xenopus tropicalis]